MVALNIRAVHQTTILQISMAETLHFLELVSQLFPQMAADLDLQNHPFLELHRTVVPVVVAVDIQVRVELQMQQVKEMMVVQHLDQVMAVVVVPVQKVEMEIHLQVMEHLGEPAVLVA
jgi:hypothetical protein